MSNKKARQLTLSQRLEEQEARVWGGEILIPQLVLRPRINFSSVSVDRWHWLPRP